MAPTIALKETCRVVAGREFPSAVPLWPWHRARLSAGGCDVRQIEEIRRAVSEAVAGYTGAPGPRIRLTVVAGPDGSAHATCERRLSSLDVPDGPIVALVSIAAVPTLPAGPAKPADRSSWDAAQAQARRLGAHQALLVTHDDAIIDGGTANVWLVMRGVLVTPPAPPAVPGVARAWLLDRAPGLGLRTEVTPIAPEDLDLADEVFLTNAFAGAGAVRGRGGRTTESVRRAFAQVWE